MERSDTLTSFINSARQATFALTERDSSAHGTAERIFVALETPTDVIEGEPSAQSSAYEYLPSALGNAAAGPAPIKNLSKTLEALAPDLSWQRRANAETQGELFYHGHINTTIIGPAGIEPRNDVIIGASLVAPDVWYPEHNHPPEELYIVMSEGDWYHESTGWYTPGIGAVVYHEPWITHAMRSGEQPLLAIWCLLTT